MKLSVGALVAGSLFATHAFAQEVLPPDNKVSTYGTIGYTYADGGSGAQFGVITGRLGVKKGYFGLEGEAGVGVAGSEILGYRLHLDYEVAGYGIATVPVTNNFQLLGRIGYGHTQISVSGLSGYGYGNSVNYGAGGILSIDEHDHIRAEYTRYDFGNSGAVNGYSIAYVRKF